MTPRALILRTAGTNCDRELAYAFELGGAETVTLHLHTLVDQPELLKGFELVGFPGGFSYGDDIAAGRILANRLRHRLMGPLREAVARGVAMIGVCNGFQVLVKAGLLPGGGGGGEGVCGGGGEQTATLAENTSGRFVDRWVTLRAEAGSRCVWTRGLEGEPMELPIAHGEGRFTAPPGVLAGLTESGQVALRYAQGENPNGSSQDIAGVCDPTGLVLGLMPHPERYTDPTHHPAWTRRGPEWLTRTPTGLRFFQNAVAAVRGGMRERVNKGAGERSKF